jgi:hypothetical protein
MTGLARIVSVAAVLLAASPWGPASAEMTEKNLQIAARSLAFMTGRSIGALKVAIVYAPEIAASKAEADHLVAQLHGNFTAGRVTLIPLPPEQLRVGDLDALKDRDVAFVTDGLTALHATIAAAAAAQKVVTVTTDLDCVTQAHCVMAVQSEPRVRILINRAAAQRSSIEFAPGFRLLVTEL